jgi:tRNA-binding protein
MATIEDFHLLDIRVGEIVSASLNPRARKPAYHLVLDFGPQLGTRESSAQLCDNYAPEQLLGRQVLAVVNFPPRQVAGVLSQVLVLATLCPERGTILVEPEQRVELGSILA